MSEGLAASGRPTARPAAQGRARDLAAGALLALAYWAAAVAGLQWALVGGAGSPVWPAAGVGLAGLLLGGLRLWPAIVVGRLAAGLTVGSELGLWAELAIAGGNALAAGLPALLLRRWLPLDPALSAMRDLLRLVLAALLSASLAAAIGTGVLWLALSDPAGDPAGAARADPGLAWAAGMASRWWLGCLVGLLVVTPPLLAWSRREAWRLRPLAWLHLAAALAAVAAVAYLIFLDRGDEGLRTWHLFPPLVWTAIAFHVRGASAALLVASLLALWGAATGSGNFAELAGSTPARLLIAQEFSAIASLTILVLGAAADERRGKAALERSRARLRDVLESTNDSVFTLDHQWRFSYLNRRAKAQLAQGRSLLGRNIWEVFPEAVGGPFWQAYHETLETGRPTRTETWYAPLDAWIEANAYASEDRLTVFFRDVGERRAAAAAREEAEARLRAILEQMPIGVATAAVPSGELLFHNTRAIELIGHPLRPADSTEGYVRYGAVHADGTAYRPEEYPIARAVLHGETVDRQRMRYRRGDGSLIALEVSAAPIRDREGRALLAVSTFDDVTERERAEAALKESERRLRLAQSVGGIVTWDWDVESGAIAWSGTARGLFGLPDEAPLPDWPGFLRLVHPDDLPAVRARVGEALDQDRPYANEFRIVRPDGRARWLAARGETVRRDAAGCPTRMIGVNYDVTERREATESLARLNAELERRVEEGAARLLHLQKMESLGRLTGGIAHDFNNLLMAILVSLDLLRKRLPADDARAAQLLDNALGGARRGADLTQRMLAFARRQELRPAPVDVAALVEGMLDLLRRSLGPEIEIETRFAPGLPPALVDAGQLEMALLNLAVNARDAMPEGGRLTIEVEAADAGDPARAAEAAADAAAGAPTGAAPAGFLRLRLTDSGRGMDPETLARAGEPFFTTKGVGKGTGLGLAMVQGLAEQSGGSLSLTSAPGRGTTAEILLPLAEGGDRAGDEAGDEVADRVPAAAPAPAAASAAAPGPADGTPAPAPRRLSVLAVDDDALILMGTAAMLEDLGHRPLEAGSATRALELLRGGAEVDLVLTDQAMPGMTGLQLAAAIREEFPRLPVVLATGYAELPADADRLVSARLAKPFRQETLAGVLARVADG